ncbi:MAG: Ig-like domain-containing protein [Lachnospiraceae bacterium]|nr:Ig-like domain-containing protein [Lachnospiraceae bacterium]
MRRRNSIRVMFSVFLVVSLVIGTVFAEKSIMSAASSSMKGIRIKINNKNVTKKTFSMKQGKKQKLKVIVPRQNKAKVAFRSNKRNIVSVTKTGKLTAKQIGSAKITVTAKVKKKQYKGWVKIKVISPEKNKSEKVKKDTVAEQSGPSPDSSDSENTPETDDIKNMKMNVQVGDKSFTATLEDNAATRELVEMMREAPISIDMNDYSGFEKVGPLGKSLTTDNQQTTTGPGDIVLYNGNQIVMFYGSNSWSYTRIGKIDDLSGWKDALGSGSITAVFSLSTK